MQIRCCQCGRPLADVDPPDIKDDGTIRSALRMLSATGLDFTAAAAALTNPTPDSLAAILKARCPNGTHITA